MWRVLWIGSIDKFHIFRRFMTSFDIELVPFESVDGVMRENNRREVAAVVLCGENAELRNEIRRLAAAWPGLPILVATQSGVPYHIRHALDAGAGNVVDLRLRDAPALVANVRQAVERYQVRLREYDLLKRLYHLNDEFLKNVVTMEKRNLELEDQIRPLNGNANLIPEGAPYRVLVVDDESSICEVFRCILEELGYSVSTAATGEMAVRLFQADPFPLVITDKNLPGIDGLDVLVAVKKRQAETEVIMITGYASKDAAVEALNCGAVAFWEKPFPNIMTVSKQIADVVENQRKRLRHRGHLEIIKKRNREFLDKYRVIRADLESWLNQSSPQDKHE